MKRIEPGGWGIEAYGRRQPGGFPWGVLLLFLALMLLAGSALGYAVFRLTHQ